MKTNGPLLLAVAAIIVSVVIEGPATLGDTVAQTQPAAGRGDELGLPVPEFEVKDATFRQAVEGLARQAHANIAVRWEDLEGKSISAYETLRLHLWGTTVGGALRALLALADGSDRTSINVSDGVILIVAAEQAPGSIPVHVYDIRDLLDAAVRYDRSRTERASPAVAKQGPGPTALTMDEAVDTITHLIESTVDSDTWKDNGGSIGFIQEFGGLLIVAQTPANHRKIAALLRTLRAGGSKDGMPTFLQNVTRPAQ